MELTCCHGNHYDFRTSLKLLPDKRVTKDVYSLTPFIIYQHTTMKNPYEPPWKTKSDIVWFHAFVFFLYHFDRLTSWNMTSIPVIDISALCNKGKFFLLLIPLAGFILLETVNRLKGLRSHLFKNILFVVQMCQQLKLQNPASVCLV